MINDSDDITLDKELQLVFINDDPTTEVYRSQIEDRIKDYITFHEVGRVGVSIVMNNAREDLGEPSGEGTMLNLYNLFYAYFHFDLAG